MKDLSHISIISVGEILFDMLPTGKQPGGAPMNVAVQIACNGITSAMITRVGSDELGQELIAFLNKKGVNTDLIQIDDEKSTGIVNVEVDDNGSPSYEIVEDVAWDYIDTSFNDYMLDPTFIVYGTLASRNEKSYQSIYSLITNSGAKLVLDLNLREPFIDERKIKALLAKASIVKVNEDEFDLLKGWYGITTKETEESIALLKQQLDDLNILIITLGAKGVIAWHSEKISKVKSFEVEVLDTVGSGDAFLGAFLSQIHKALPIEDALKFASAAGSYVAMHKGANPDYTEEVIFDFMNKNS